MFRENREITECLAVQGVDARRLADFAAKEGLALEPAAGASPDSKTTTSEPRSLGPQTE